MIQLHRIEAMLNYDSVTQYVTYGLVTSEVIKVSRTDLGKTILYLYQLIIPHPHKFEYFV